MVGFYLIQKKILKAYSKGHQFPVTLKALKSQPNKYFMEKNKITNYLRRSCCKHSMWTSKGKYTGVSNKKNINVFLPEMMCTVILAAENKEF